MSRTSPPRYTGGNQAILMAAPDTAMPESKAAIDAWIAAVPSAPAIIGYADIPDVTKNNNASKETAIGSLLAQFDAQGNKTGDLAANIRVGNVEFLKKCLLGSGGPQGLAQQALFTGVDNSLGEGYTLVHRGSMCNDITISFSEPQGDAFAPITSSANFKLLVPDTAGPALSPTLSQYRATGATLSWHNIIQAQIGADDIYNDLMAMQFKADYALESKGHVQDYGADDPVSRCHRYFRVSQNVITGDLTFHPRLAAKFIDSAKNSNQWGNLVIGCSDATAIAGGGAKAFTLTLTNVRPNVSKQKSGQSKTQMSHSISILADSMTVTTA